MAGEDESPFARVPTPGIHETPSPMTPMGEVAAYGTLARGMQSRSRWAGRIFGVLFLLLVVGGLVFGAVGWFVFDGDSGSTPERPPVPSSIPVSVPVPSLPPPPVPPTAPG
jgi:hypothetical protein